jgi:hypothetical protein
MPITLEGSCRGGAVRFSVASHTPCPYQLCYCSICRKTVGGGGFAINIMGDARTLAVTARRTLRIYHAEISNDEGNCETSSGERHFCNRCASALWLFSRRAAPARRSFILRYIGLLTSSGAPAGTGYRSTTNNMVSPVYWPMRPTISTMPRSPISAFAALKLVSLT